MRIEAVGAVERRPGLALALGAQARQRGAVDGRVEGIAVGAGEAADPGERGDDGGAALGEGCGDAHQVGARAGEHRQRQVEVTCGQRAGHRGGQRERGRDARRERQDESDGHVGVGSEGSGREAKAGVSPRR